MKLTRSISVCLMVIVSVSAVAQTTTLPPPASGPELSLTTAALKTGSEQALASGALRDYRSRLTASLTNAVAKKNVPLLEAFTSSESGSHAVMQWMLLTRLGDAASISLTKPQSECLSWLLGDRSALEFVMTGGDIQPQSWQEFTQILANIISEDPEAKTGIDLRIALATALTFSTPVHAMADGAVIDPLSRYKSFKKWNGDGVLDPSFTDLSVWELRYVVGSWATDQDLAWARANLKPELKARDKIGDGAHMLAYKDQNPSGVSVQEGRKFYDNKPMTMPIMLEYGGVCGAISRFGTAMSQAHGIPAMPVGQPGHCAFIWQKSPHNWSLNNDISGWAQSGRHDGIEITWGNQAWMIPLMQVAQANRGAFLQSELLRACALITDQNRRAGILDRACKLAPANYAAWTDLIRALASESRPNWDRFILTLTQQTAAFPMAWATLVCSIPKIGSDSSDNKKAQARFDRRVSFLQRTIMPRIIEVASNNSDSSLTAAALRTIFVDQLSRAVSNESAGAVRALLCGEAPGNAPLSIADAERVTDGFLQLALMLLNSDTETKMNQDALQSVWRQTTQPLLKGIALQPNGWKAGSEAMGSTVRKLVSMNRRTDACWLADQWMETVKNSDDKNLQASAAALKASIK